MKIAIMQPYFFSLICQFSTYNALKSSAKENLPVATNLAKEVLCLPLYAELKNEDIERIFNLIRV